MKLSRLPRPLALNSGRNPASGRAWAHLWRGAPPCGVPAPSVGLAEVEDEFLVVDREIYDTD